jgi:hypothetical protein
MNYLDISRYQEHGARGSLENAVVKVAEIKAELEVLKTGECGEKVIQALKLYKQKKEAKKEKKEAENNYWNAVGSVAKEEADFTPAKGGMRSRSRTQKRNRRSKKSRKC